MIVENGSMKEKFTTVVYCNYKYNRLINSNMQESTISYLVQNEFYCTSKSCSVVIVVLTLKFFKNNFAQNNIRSLYK